MQITSKPILKELPKGEISRSRLDNTLALTTMNWVPGISITKGIQISILK
jgi:hypothetical protein